MASEYDACPFWSTEMLDCANPVRLDFYSFCSYNCLYCFSYNQKSISLNGYLNPKEVRPINVDSVKSLFERCFAGEPKGVYDIPFVYYFQNRYTIQIGGLGDPFDLFEKKYGVGLELLRYLSDIDYPLTFSTKGDFFVDDERYMSLIRSHSHNWHFKVSIITLDKRCKYIELGVPSPERRLRVIEKLAKTNRVTLRLRPYIKGLSEDFPELIRRAREAGADSVSMEFMCVETRASENLKARYRRMSRVLGYDLWEYYRKKSPYPGYKRLTRLEKIEVIKQVRDCAHGLGMKFMVSDQHGREYSDQINCCGATTKPWTSVWQEALRIAKERGEVHFRDISEPFLIAIGNIRIISFESNISVYRRKWKTLGEFFRGLWNDYHSPKSPAAYGVLAPVRIDEDGNVVYKYIGEKIIQNTIRVNNESRCFGCNTDSGSCG